MVLVELRAWEVRAEVARRMVERGFAYVPDLRADGERWWLDVRSGDPSLPSPCVSALVDERPATAQADAVVRHLPPPRADETPALARFSIRRSGWCVPE